MAGIFEQMTESVKALVAAATDGADPDGIRIAYVALEDQWKAAEREARKTEVGSSERFETMAAIMFGEAFSPALEAAICGRDASQEVRRATEAGRWRGRAYEAHLRNDKPMVDIYFRLAEKVVDSHEPDREVD
jgi:hypothetical protein